MERRCLLEKGHPAGCPGEPDGPAPADSADLGAGMDGAQRGRASQGAQRAAVQHGIPLCGHGHPVYAGGPCVEHPVRPVRLGCAWKRAAEAGGAAPRLSETWARVRGGVDELGRLLMGLYFLCALLELALPLLGYSGYDVAARQRSCGSPGHGGRSGCGPRRSGLSCGRAGLFSVGPGTALLGERPGGGRISECLLRALYLYERGLCFLLVRAICWENSRDNYTGYGLLEFIPAELGTDEAWSARDGAFSSSAGGADSGPGGESCHGRQRAGPDCPEHLVDILDRLEMR